MGYNSEQTYSIELNSYQEHMLNNTNTFLQYMLIIAPLYQY